VAKAKGRTRARQSAPRARVRAGTLRPWHEGLRAFYPSRSWLDPWVLGVVSVLLLSKLEAYVWLGAVLSELALQLAMLACIAAAWALARKRLVRAALLFGCAVVWYAPLWPYVRGARPTPQHGPVLELVQQHLAGVSVSGAVLGRWLANERPDVLSLSGLAPRSAVALAASAPGYKQLPLRHAGNGLLLARSELLATGAGKTSAAMRVGRCTLELTQVELPSRFDARAQHARQASIAALVRQPLATRHVLLGEFGSRSAASDLEPLLSQKALRDARLGHGVLATAPGALGALGLPLDQLLLRGWLLVRDAGAMPPMVEGAHRALKATLELTEPRCAGAATR
jgi:hypothetical protein